MNKYTRFIVIGIVVMIASGLLYFKFNQLKNDKKYCRKIICG
jgi:hypothetical protein